MADRYDDFPLSQRPAVRVVKGHRPVSAGQMLRAIRLRARMSQELLADVADVSLATIWRIESGQRGAGVTVLAALRSALDMRDDEACDLVCLAVYGEVLRSGHSEEGDR